MKYKFEWDEKKNSVNIKKVLHKGMAKPG